MKVTSHDCGDGPGLDLHGPADAAWRPLPLPEEIEGVEPSALKPFLAFHNLFNTFTRLVLGDLTHGGTQPSHMECLRVLAIGDGLCQRDIADALRVSRARVTSIVQALERAGYVTRVRDEVDQRFARVYLTDLGRATDREKGRLRQQHINDVFGGMSEEDRGELTRRLHDLDARFRNALQIDG